MTPQFLYFDLGNVLLHFDHLRACRQMAAVAGIDPEQVWEIAFTGDLLNRFESGEMSGQQFYEHFCQQSGKRPPLGPLALAASDIFEIIVPMKAVLAGLSAAGHRLGLLSNTNVWHWEYFSADRFGLIPQAFEQVILSFEERCMKPDPKIFRTAIERAGVPAERIFYVDDIAGHVAARAVGIDAVQFTTVPALVDELVKREVGFNY